MYYQNGGDSDEGELIVSLQKEYGKNLKFSLEKGAILLDSDRITTNLIVRLINYSGSGRQGDVLKYLELKAMCDISYGIDAFLISGIIPKKGLHKYLFEEEGENIVEEYEKAMSDLIEAGHIDPHNIKDLSIEEIIDGLQHPLDIVTTRFCKAKRDYDTIKNSSLMIEKPNIYGSNIKYKWAL